MRQAVIPGMTAMFSAKDNGIRNMSSVNYVLTPNQRIMRSGFYSYIPLALHQNRTYSITYDTYEAHLLKKPFETECEDYKGLGLGSRGDCYESCLRHETLAKEGEIPHGVNIMPNETERLMSMKKMFNTTIKALMMDLGIQCDKRCLAKDCTSVAHIPRKLTSSKTAKIGFNNISPQSPTIRASCQPMLTMTQFLTDLVSTLGFWLGLSALGIFRFFKRSSRAIAEAYIVEENEKNKNWIGKRLAKEKRVHYGNRHPDLYMVQARCDIMAVNNISGKCETPDSSL